MLKMYESTAQQSWLNRALPEATTSGSNKIFFSSSLPLFKEQKTSKHLSPVLRLNLHKLCIFVCAVRTFPEKSLNHTHYVNLVLG